MTVIIFFVLECTTVTEYCTNTYSAFN